MSSSEDTMIRAQAVKIELAETQAAFDLCREGIVEKMIVAGTPDAAYRGAMAVQALDKVREYLLSVAQSGDVEQHHAEQAAIFEPL